MDKNNNDSCEVSTNSTNQNTLDYDSDVHSHQSQNLLSNENNISHTQDKPTTPSKYDDTKLYTLPEIAQLICDYYGNNNIKLEFNPKLPIVDGCGVEFIDNTYGVLLASC